MNKGRSGCPIGHTGEFYKEVMTLDKAAERLIRLRGDRSREEVARAVGVSVSAIAMYENGERIPRDSIKIKLAAYFNTTVQEIFFD